MIEYLPSINATNLQFSGKNVLNISREIISAKIPTKNYPPLQSSQWGKGLRILLVP